MSSYTIDKQLEYIIRENNVIVFHNDAITKDRAINQSNKDKDNYLDLSSFKVNDIINFLKLKNINVFVFFTFKSDLDKLLFDICTLLHIPTILHDHGVVFGSTPTRSGFKITLPKIKRKLIYLKKNLDLCFIKKGFNINAIIDFINFSKVKREFNHFLLYSVSNKEYYSTFFDINEKNSTISGVPLFPSYDTLIELNKIQPERKLLYICQPFIKYNLSSLSRTEEIVFFTILSDIAKRNNFSLEIRLHPAQSINEYKNYIWDTNITFKNDITLEQQAALSTGIIGHWSTGLAIAKPLNIPLILIEYPKIYKKYINYLSIYKNVGLYCKDYSQLDSALKQISNGFNYSDSLNIEWEKLIGNNNTFETNAMFFLSIVKSICSDYNRNKLQLFM